MQAAQQAGRREHNEHCRQPRARDREIDDRLLSHPRVGAKEPDERRAHRPEAHPEHGTKAECEPEPVDARLHGAPQIARAPPARHQGCGGVGQEDHEPDRCLQDGARDREAGQRFGAEVADERRVDDEKEGLGDERPERGNRETGDAAVDCAAAACAAYCLGARLILAL